MSVAPALAQRPEPESELGSRPSEPAKVSDESREQPVASDYDKLIRDAIAAQEAGAFERAHALFAEAHRQQPSARTLRGFGVTSFQAGHYLRAMEELGAALAHPGRPLEGSLRDATEELRRRAEAQLGTVAVEVDPPSAQIFVDALPDPRAAGEALFLEPGAHALRIVAIGFQGQELGIEVAAGSRQTLHVRLRSAPSDAAEAVPERQRDAWSPPHPREVLSGRITKGRSRRRVAQWSLLSLGGASLLTAGGLYFGASHRLDSIAEECAATEAGSCTEEQRDRELRRAKITTFERSITTTSTIAAAALLASGGLWLWSLQDGKATVGVVIQVHGAHVTAAF
jgi:hypothetical protein